MPHRATINESRSINQHNQINIVDVVYVALCSALRLCVACILLTVYIISLQCMRSTVVQALNGASDAETRSSHSFSCAAHSTTSGSTSQQSIVNTLNMPPPAAAGACPHVFTRSSSERRPGSEREGRLHGSRDRPGEGPPLPSSSTVALPDISIHFPVHPPVHQPVYPPACWPPVQLPVQSAAGQVLRPVTGVYRNGSPRYRSTTLSPEEQQAVIVWREGGRPKKRSEFDFRRQIVQEAMRCAKALPVFITLITIIVA